MSFCWPDQWSKFDILRDITCLELIPIAVSVCLWKKRFKAKCIQFACDNMTVVHIFNSKTAMASFQRHR